MGLSSARGQQLTLGLAVFVSMLGVGVVVPLLPLYARDLGASSLLLGLIFSSFPAARALASAYLGAWSDYLGRRRRRLLLAGLLGYAGLSLAMAWAGSIPLLVQARSAQAVCAAMGFFAMAFSAGVCLGPLMGGLPLAFYHAGAWALLGAGGLWLLLPRPGADPVAAR